MSRIGSGDGHIINGFVVSRRDNNQSHVPHFVIIMAGKKKKNGKATQQRSTVVNVVERPLPRRRPPITFRPGVHPFVSCFMSPTGSLDTATGIPDGSCCRSLPFEHKQLFQVYSNGAGEISFAIVPSALGGFAIQKGKVSAILYAAAAAGGWNAHVVDTDSATWVASQQPGTYHIIPFVQYTHGNPTLADDPLGQNDSFMNADKWRVISSKAKFFYSGSLTTGAGYINAARATIVASSTSIPISTVPVDWYNHGGYQITDTGPANLQELANCPDAEVLPLMNLMGNVAEVNNTHTSAQFEWQPFREGLVPVTTAPEQAPTEAFDQLGWNPPMGGPWPGPEQYIHLPMPGLSDMTTTFVQFSGFPAGSSIMLQVSNCVEYVVAPNSNFSKMAKPTTPRDANALTTVLELGKRLPAIAQGEAIANGGWWSQLRGHLGNFGREVGEFIAAGAGSKLVRGAGSALMAFARARGKRSTRGGIVGNMAGLSINSPLSRGYY